jgi:hypothetical protein
MEHPPGPPGADGVALRLGDALGVLERLRGLGRAAEEPQDMEGYPPMPGLVEELMAATGYERAAFHTLEAHATLDQGHRDELDEAIDALPLTAAHEDVLGLSALSSVAMMARVVDEVVSRAPA